MQHLSILHVLFFFLRIALAILGVLWFHTNVRNICFMSLKNVLGNFGGDGIAPMNYFR